MTRRRFRFLRPLLALLPAVSLGSCDPDGGPAAPSSASAYGTIESLTHTGATFPTWHQGFNHDTEGWYGAGTPGELGWCGDIVRMTGGDPRPSAGRGYAVVSQGVCNDLWDATYSFPGGTLVGAPWAPGPDFAALGESWPVGGYVVELDIWLDPAWDAVPPEEGTWVFEESIAGTGAVLGYSVSFQTPEDGAYHYLRVPVMPGDGRLVVGDGHEVTEPGWYTFRHVFRDEGGSLAVEFQIAEAHGGVLGTETVGAVYFEPGVSPSDFATDDVAPGYAWFTSISQGLDLPIDEYRVRRGGP